MATYGVDVYGKALYGTDLGIDYTVTDLHAVQSDYGRITVSWSAPRQNNWTSLLLVRSGYGYPVALTDGVQLAAWPNTGTTTSYDDVGLQPGYWYYTVFASLPYANWSASQTYSTGDRVAYSGTVWVCVTSYSVGTTPGTDSTQWIATEEITQYHPAGSISCLCVQNHGYGPMLDELVPAPYKALPGTSTDTGNLNDDLTAFLSVLGFGFDQIATELDDLLNAYEVTTTRQDRLYDLGATLGLSAELASSTRFQRLRTLSAAAINQQRGTAAGIAQTIYAATGLTAVITTGPNMMLTQDQSAFATPQPAAWDPAEPYKLGDQVIYRGARYTVTGSNTVINSSNYVAQGLTGTPNALTLSGSVITEASATGPTTMSIPFTAIASGSYYALVQSNYGTAMGILSATLDGQPLLIGKQPTQLGRLLITPVYVATIDLYSATSTASQGILTNPAALLPGSHTLVLTCTAKNSSSSGFNIQALAIYIYGSPVVYPPGNPPTGAANSAAQWTTSSPATNYTLYANPATGGQGTWSQLGSATATLATAYLGG